MRGSSLALLGFVCLFAAAVVFIMLRNDQLADAPLVGTPQGADAQLPRNESALPETTSPAVGESGGVRSQAPESDSTLPSHDSAEVAHAAVPVAPLKFPMWPSPQLALVATGEQLGYFEPCGCTANQLGGMSRRASLFDKIRSLGWDVRGIDVGSVSRRTGTQAKLKFETTLEALRELRYVGLGLGPEELKLEPGYLLSQHLTDGEDRLTFLSANVTFFGSKDLDTVDLENH